VSIEHYTREFYDGIRNGVTRSAEAILPLVLELLPVRSVVDVGCGDGGWLAAFKKLGVEEILGIDGEYIDRDLLQIPKERFQVLDLTKPFSLGRTFDLAVSLEVAEHLPAECARAFVESLTRLAPVVLFSAAIPLQGGNHHVNEQWPDNWAALFREHGYVPVDFIRKRVWQNEAVEWWYAQNMLLFAQAGVVESNATLNAEFEKTNPNQLSLVHPRKYLEALNPPPAPPPSGVREASRALWLCLKNAIRKRLNPVERKRLLSPKDRTTVNQTFKN
jgi:SAM-dependent methyltransferase